MQLATETPMPSSKDPGFPVIENETQRDARYGEYKIIRRNGAVVGFEPGKISVAVTKAFIAVNGGQGAASARVRELVAQLTESIVNALMRRQPQGGTFHIEDIQDQVELALMRSGEHDVARAYVLYREERTRERARQKEAQAIPAAQVIQVNDRGTLRPLDVNALATLVSDACSGLGKAVDPSQILHSIMKDLYEGVPMDEVRKCSVLAARALIEKDPAYGFVTARLLLDNIRYEVLGESVMQSAMGERYAEYFPQFIKKGIAAGLLDERLGGYDLQRLGQALLADRDFKFGYLGLQTLFDR